MQLQQTNVKLNYIYKKIKMSVRPRLVQTRNLTLINRAIRTIQFLPSKLSPISKGARVYFRNVTNVAISFNL